MSTNDHRTAQLGDLVVAAFDDAACFSSDPAEVSRIATRRVIDLVRRSRRSAATLSRLSSRTIGRTGR